MSGATSVRIAPLSGDELVAFYERGWLRVGRVIDDATLQRVRDEVNKRRRGREEVDLLDPKLWEKGEGGAPQEPGRSVSFLFNLWRVSEVYRDLVMTPRFGRWASQVLGARRVRVLEDNALSKDPHTGGALKWHQDYSYWPLAQPAAVTLWIALDDVTIENGAMLMANGSHLRGEKLPAVFGTGASYFRERRPKTVEQIVDPKSLGMEIEPVTLQAGEASLHHSLTWHASGANDTSNPRRAAVCRYVADGTIWLGERRYEYNYSSEQCGLAVGDPISGEYFPLVPDYVA